MKFVGLAVSRCFRPWPVFPWTPAAFCLVLRRLCQAEPAPRPRVYCTRSVAPAVLHAQTERTGRAESDAQGRGHRAELAAEI